MWFGYCAIGTNDDVKKLIKRCAKQKDARMNDYSSFLYTGFTGLMYAIINDNIQVFETLANEEYDVNLDKEQVLYFDEKYYYLSQGFTPLHLAALAGNQQFFNMLMKIYEQKKVPMLYAAGTQP